MAGIYHPSRGGVRGGRDQFDWDDVKSDKDRECYLGHSVMVPTGKWQEGKDLIWYTRDKKNKSEIELKKKKELNTVKDLEARAMAAALGHESFSVGSGTSLTAKELQEVLSRGKTEHTEGERIEGVGHKKKLSSGKAEKSGMSFQGFNTTQGGGSESDVERQESSIKKKKNKKEKKKKKKRKRTSSDSESDVKETEEKRRRRRQRYLSDPDVKKSYRNEPTKTISNKTNYPKDNRRRENNDYERRYSSHDKDKNARRDEDRIGSNSRREQDRHTSDKGHSRIRRSKSRSPERRRKSSPPKRGEKRKDSSSTKRQYRRRHDSSSSNDSR